MERNNPVSIQPDAGDIVYFYYENASKNKFAVNLEPLAIHKNKNTFNAVIITSQRTDHIYPCDYLLPEGTIQPPQGIEEKKSKVLCDQPTLLPKQDIIDKAGSVSKKDLEEIRKKVGISLGIFEYDITTTSDDTEQ